MTEHTQPRPHRVHPRSATTVDLQPLVLPLHLHRGVDSSSSPIRPITAPLPLLYLSALTSSAAMSDVQTAPSEADEQAAPNDVAAHVQDHRDADLDHTDGKLTATVENQPLPPTLNTEADQDFDSGAPDGNQSDAPCAKNGDEFCIDRVDIQRMWSVLVSIPEFRTDNRHLTDDQWSQLSADPPVFPASAPIFAIREYHKKGCHVTLERGRARVSMGLRGSHRLYRLLKRMVTENRPNQADLSVFDVSHLINQFGPLDKAVINPNLMVYEEPGVNRTRGFCFMHYRSLLKGNPNDGETDAQFDLRVREEALSVCRKVHTRAECVFSDLPQSTLKELEEIYAAACQGRKSRSKSPLVQVKDIAPAASLRADEIVGLVPSGKRKSTGHSCRFPECPHRKPLLNDTVRPPLSFLERRNTQESKERGTLLHTCPHCQATQLTQLNAHIRTAHPEEWDQLKSAKRASRQHKSIAPKEEASAANPSAHLPPVDPMQQATADGAHHESAAGVHAGEEEMRDREVDSAEKAHANQQAEQEDAAAARIDG